MTTRAELTRQRSLMLADGFDARAVDAWLESRIAESAPRTWGDRDAMELPSGDAVMRIANRIGWTDMTEEDREWISMTLPSDVYEFLDANKGNEVTFLLNTPGGSVFGGTEIANLILGHEAGTRAIVTGIAASVGSLIAAACETVEMMEASMMMIHGPQTFAVGAAEDMRAVADRLDKEAESVAPIYKRRMEADEVDRMLASGDHYMTAAEAVESGIADGIYSDSSGGEGGVDKDDDAVLNSDDEPDGPAIDAMLKKRNQDRLAFLATGML